MICSWMIIEVDPAVLKTDNQMDLFSIEHESRYEDLISRLISHFIPPENATAALSAEKYGKICRLPHLSFF